MEGAAAQVGVEGGEPPGWWNSWDGADTDALVALGGGIDTIRDKLLAMDEKIGGQGLTIVGVPEPRKFKKSSQIWNGSELGTTQYFAVAWISTSKVCRRGMWSRRSMPWARCPSPPLRPPRSPLSTWRWST